MDTTELTPRQLFQLAWQFIRESELGQRLTSTLEEHTDHPHWQFYIDIAEECREADDRSELHSQPEWPTLWTLRHYLDPQYDWDDRESARSSLMRRRWKRRAGGSPRRLPA